MALARAETVDDNLETPRTRGEKGRPSAKGRRGSRRMENSLRANKHSYLIRPAPATPNSPPPPSPSPPSPPLHPTERLHLAKPRMPR